MNVKLLQQVRDHILEEPKRLDMAVVLRPAPRNACKTAGCIDGWAQFLSGSAKAPACLRFDPNYAIGREILDLTYEQAQRLFADPARSYDAENDEYEEYCWPDEFLDAYLKARNATHRAKITAERIDHFIATKGLE